MRFVLVIGLMAACQSSDVSRDVGARCDTNADCNQKCEVPSANWPDGFCTLLCDTDANCPENTVCIDEDGGICAFTCAADPDCTFLGAYSCKQRDSHGGGVKVNACRGD
jgi:hypothetical protein